MLTRFLPDQLDHLRTALTAEPVTLASIPPEVSRDWLLPDGRARVQVMSTPQARSSQGLHEFVAQVTAVAPDAGGSAVTIEATSETIVGAFRSAAIIAVVAITVILFLALRRVLDVGLVLAPLILSALLTLLVTVLLRLPLNFANIIALPLLLGVGVSFNIYFVMNWRAGRHAVLGSATARAIVFSALTTGTAFGSLALSAHPGTASMGRLLLISLACTLAGEPRVRPRAAVERPRTNQALTRPVMLTRCVRSRQLAADGGCVGWSPQPADCPTNLGGTDAAIVARPCGRPGVPRALPARPTSICRSAAWHRVS